MPLKITNPSTQVAVLNKWADWIELQLKKTQAKVAATNKTANNPVVSGGGGGLTSVVLTAPPEITVTTTSPSSTEQDIELSWTDESPGSVFMVPPAGSPDLVGNALNPTTINSTIAQTISRAIADGDDGFALYIATGSCITSASTTPSGWTLIKNMTYSGSTVGTVAYKATTGGSSSSATQTFQGGSPLLGTVNSGVIQALLAFKNSGGTPSVIQSKTSSVSASGTSAFTSSVSAGSTLLVIGQTFNVSNPVVVSGITDTNGNNYSLVSGTQALGGHSTSPVYVTQTVYMASNAASGATTVTFALNGTISGGINGNLTLIEISAVDTGGNTPLFSTLVTSMIPPINAEGGIFGKVPLSNGGTHADLSATGGASQVLKQSSVGAAITVGKLDYNDIAGGSGNLAAKYNGVTLVSQGLVTEQGLVDSNNLSANVGLTTIFTPSASGLYKISGRMIVKTVGTISSTLPDIQFQWQDADNTTTQSKSFVASSPSGNTLTTSVDFSFPIYASGSQAVKYQTGDSTAYASSGATSMVYSLRIRVEAL